MYYIIYPGMAIDFQQALPTSAQGAVWRSMSAERIEVNV